MKEDFVTYEIAKKLKEKGFYYKCVATYDNDGMLGYNYIQPTNIRAIGFDDCLCSHNVENDNCVDAPTISQVLKWLREEYELYLCPSVIADYQDDFHRYMAYWSFVVVNIASADSIYREYERVTEKRYDNYEQAALAGIEYVIDNLI